MKFADTSWWVAWIMPRDRRHEAASTIAASLGRQEQILTTNLVVGESWTFLRRKAGHYYAIQYLDRVDVLRDAGQLQVHAIAEPEEAAAWRWLRKHDERVYSFVDATSFEVMRRRRLREALAFDNDFAAAGFIEIRPHD